MSRSGEEITGRVPIGARAAAFLEATKRPLGLTNNGMVLVAVAVGGWVVARLLGGRAAFLVVYATTMVVIVSCVVVRRRSAVSAQRSALSPRVTADQLVEVELLLTAQRRTTNVIVEEHLPPALGAPVRVPITSLPAGQAAKHVYSFSPRRRGVYSVGPLVLTRSDPFGLSQSSTVLAEPIEIIVHPRTEPIHDRIVTREWEDPPIRPPVSKPWPTGFDFYGMRDYAMGDDPRRIVWRAAARTIDPVTGAGRYLVRESEQGITDRVALLLDTDLRSHSPGTPSETFEVAVRLVASLGRRHLRDGFAVTLETNGGRVANALRGDRNRIRLLDHLARIERERASLGELIRRLANDRRQRNLHNVVVTPSLDAAAASSLRLLTARGTSVLVVVVLWEDTDPASVSRAAALGCTVVEVEPDMVFEAAFRRLVGAGVRREQ